MMPINFEIDRPRGTLTVRNCEAWVEISIWDKIRKEVTDIQLNYNELPELIEFLTELSKLG